RVGVFVVFVFSAAWQMPLGVAGECDAALVKSTLLTSSSAHTDWRLAVLVTRENYDSLQKDFGASTVIFGIPMGTTYNEFHTNYQLQLSGNYAGFTTAGIILEPLKGPPHPVNLITVDLAARTFEPVQSHGKTQIRGCGCSNDAPLIMNENNTPISVINAKVGQ